MQTPSFDILVIGSGAAGLTLALSLADHANIAIISKSPLLDSSSQQAQGGIATVMAKEDSIESHLRDTLKAGAGLCDPIVVKFTVEQARPAIEWLISQGVMFTQEETPQHKAEKQKTKGLFHLNKEGGHTHRRILHVDDKTGYVVVHTLAHQALNHQNITCFTEHTAIDLICEHDQCIGCLVLDNHAQELKLFSAKKIVLATGGTSFVYSHTTNADRTTGDGIAMAYRAGCRIADMEFQQFHPTCLYHQNSTFLISESVRGEGGILILPDGTRFMSAYDKRLELAPRDIVTRAIKTEMDKHHLDHVYVDITHKPAEFIQKRFPTIYQRCLDCGIDMTKEPIPVSPAAHYTCGGVVTDLSGQTTLKNLFAVGETAFTGLHGANRMASNSLLECLVFAVSAAKTIEHELQQLPFSKINSKTDIDFHETEKQKTTHLPVESLYQSQMSFHGLAQIDPSILVSQRGGEEKATGVYMSYMTVANDDANKAENQKTKGIIQQIREMMWEKVSIIRSNISLQQAEKMIASIQRQVNESFSKTVLSKELIELRNLTETAMLIIQSALLRKESRGAHYTIDYDFEILPPAHTVIGKR